MLVDRRLDWMGSASLHPLSYLGWTAGLETKQKRSYKRATKPQSQPFHHPLFGSLI